MNWCSLLLLVLFSCMWNRIRHDQEHDVQNIYVYLAFRHSNFHSQSHFRNHLGWHITNSQMQFPAMPSPSSYKICDKRTHCIYWVRHGYTVRKDARNFYWYSNQMNSSVRLKWIVGLIKYSYRNLFVAYFPHIICQLKISMHSKLLHLHAIHRSMLNLPIHRQKAYTIIHSSFEHSSNLN